MSLNFAFARTPQIHFGAGSFERLGEIIARHGKRALLVTGASSLTKSGRARALAGQLAARSVGLSTHVVDGEPSPEAVDAAVRAYAHESIDVVCAVGGGSVIDAGKAISAMLPCRGSVADYLEGVGTKTHDGAKIPFVAVPTTAGTGSEATKNAVLSRPGVNGFKKSLRHDSFVPDVALVDPALTLACPSGITAACGMDALTQLLEAFVSPAASPMTDALACAGLSHLRDNLLPACTTGAGDITVRTAMAYAALMSGIALANAGLGIVHALASPLGAHFPVSHGVACGSLVGAATRTNIAALRQRAPQSPALVKYGRAGAMLSGNAHASPDEGCGLLVDTIDDWTRRLGLPLLSDFGVSAADAGEIAAGLVCTTNAVELTEAEVKGILTQRITSAG